MIISVKMYVGDKIAPSKPIITARSGYVHGLHTKNKVILAIDSIDNITATEDLIFEYSTPPYMYHNSWKKISKPYEISTTTYNNVYVRAIDKAGNTSEISEYFQVIVDQTNPIINGVENNKVYKTTINYDVIDRINSLNTLDIVTLNDELIENSGTIDKSGEYTLKAVDKSGNETVVNFTIDIDAPVITFSGPDYLEMGFLDFTYNTTTSFTAFDNLDGELTNKVEIILPEGLKRYKEKILLKNYDILLPERAGTYEITYKVSDKVGNETIEIRTIKFEGLNGLLGKLFRPIITDLFR